MLTLLNQIRIVLLEPSHPGNIGAVARAMKTMGLSRLYLVQPKKFPHYEASKRAAGAASVLDSATVVASIDSAIDDCTAVLGTSVRDREVSWPTFDPRKSAQKVVAHLLAPGVVHLSDQSLQSNNSQREVAILFGRESSGLSNREMDLCDSQIRIPANDDYSSLNLASAVQIIAYELRMKCMGIVDDGSPSTNKITSELTPAQVRQQPANKAQQEGHIQHLQKTLETLDFISSKPPTTLMRKLTRLYNKAELTIEEIQILRGILSAIDSKIKE